MKKYILLALYCCFFHLTFGQIQSPQNNTIKGIVIDSVVNKPLAYITVVLQDSASKISIKGTLTKEDGSFELAVPAGKTYQLIVASIGYEPKKLTIKPVGQTLDLNKIYLSTSSRQLKEVTITAVKPIMKREVDRLSYDIQADPESRTSTALDMIRKVPLLSVDGDDKVRLKGSGNYKILLNGRESSLMAKNPSDVLKAMPAINIEKIEVITTPPAKYDAEGLAGIINIITKRNAAQGYNAGVSVRYNTIGVQNYNANVNIQQGKFGLSGFASLGHQNKFRTSTESSQTQFATQSLLTQNSDGFSDGEFKYANADLSYEIDTLNLLTGSFALSGSNFNQNNIQLTKQTGKTGDISRLILVHPRASTKTTVLI